MSGPKIVMRSAVVASALLTVAPVTRPMGVTLCALFGISLVGLPLIMFGIYAAFPQVKEIEPLEPADSRKAVTTGVIGVALLVLAALQAGVA